MKLGKNNQPEVGAAEFMKVCQERDDLQNQLRAARRANDSLMEEIEQLKARATEAHGQFQKRVKELGDGLDAATALLKTAQDERDKARAIADAVLQEVESQKVLVADYKKRVEDQVEVIERLKEQNARFVEEQREAKQREAEAKQRAASLAADNARAREEVARLVRLNDDFRERLQKVTTEKNQILEISNGFARERDEIRADYDARGKVIKKLRKRLHKLKKKLKH